MENTELTRIVIHTRDVAKHLGISNRNARRLMDMVRSVYGRRPSGLVTIKEFCEYHDFDMEELKMKLKMEETA